MSASTFQFLLDLSPGQKRVSRRPGLAGGSENYSTSRDTSHLTKASDFLRTYVSARPTTTIHAILALFVCWIDKTSTKPANRTTMTILREWSASAGGKETRYRAIVRGKELVSTSLIEKISFNPALILGPHWEIWRMFTNVLIISGCGKVETLLAAVDLLQTSGALEITLNGPGTTYQGGVIVERVPSQSNKSILRRYIFENRYLKVESIVAITLAILEILLWRSNATVSSRASRTLWFWPRANFRFRPILPSTSMSLYPELSYANVFLLGFVCPEMRVRLFAGLFPVKAIAAPFLLCALGGFNDWRSCIKGAFAASIAAVVMGLKRQGSNEDLVRWLRRSGRELKQFLRSVAPIRA